MSGLAFRVLGPLEVVRGGTRLKLAGERQHALLALLLLRANEVVPSEQILEELFLDVARDPANALQVAVSRLRRTLEDGVLVTRPRGYLLRVEPDDLDSAVFERLSEQGRRLLADGDTDAAASALRSALALWRGPPLQEIALFDFAQPEIRRLEELHLAATMDRIDAELALGAAGELVPELESLVAAHPLQERLRGQLMLALYRDGRQAEALETYRRTRELLRDELGLEPSRALQRLEHAILNQDWQLEPPRATVCPFKGLASYSIDDAPFFCGRERLVAELVSRLAASSFVAIVGASGSGKSSLLHAGLLPALQAGALPGSADWTTAAIRPGDPIPPAKLVAVDQFEEVFRSGHVAWLHQLLRTTESARVVICLRADFYGRCAEHRELAELVARSQVLVGQLEPDELRRAIEAPAARADLEAEPQLVDALVADAQGQTGALPLLSTALLELWRLRGGEVLRLETYRAAGGIDGAVARLAEHAYRRLSPSERDAARRLLLRLADEGPEAPVRRRVPLAELAEDERGILDALTAERLITVGDDVVEVAHEALLREWPRLRDWLESDVEGRRLHRSLTLQSHAWDEGGRDDADLWRGTRLEAALEWATSHAAETGNTERAFLAASRRASQRALRRLRALSGVLAVLLAIAAAAALVALEQRQAARRDARIALATRLGAQAVAQPRLDLGLLLAREAVRIHDSPQTEQALLATLLRSPAAVASYALPAGTRAYHVNVSPDGQTLLVADSDGALHFFDTRTRAQTRPVYRGAFGFGPTIYDGPRLLTLATSLHGIDVRDARTLRPQRFLRFDPHWIPGKTGAVTPLVSADGAAFFAYDLVIDQRNDEGPAFLDRWQLTTGTRASVHLGSPNVVGAGLAHGKLVTVTSDLIETWDARTLRRLHVVRPQVELGGYAAVDPRGRFVAGLTHLTHGVVFVDLRTGRVTPAAQAGSALSVGFSPDGRYAVTTGLDGTVTVWDPASGAAVDRLAGHSAAANGSAFSPDGRTLYASSLDGTVLAWAIDHRRRFGERFAVPPQPHDLPQVPQAPPLAVVGGTVVLRDGGGLTTCALVCRPVAGSHGSLVTTLASNGTLLAVGRRDGSVELWSNGRLRRRLAGLTTSVQSVAVAPSLVAAVDLHKLELWGRQEVSLRLPAPGTAVALDEADVAVGLADGRVLVVEHGRIARTLRPHGAPKLSLAFLPDGTLLTGSFDGSLERWNATSGLRLDAASSIPTGPVSRIAVDGTAVFTSSLTTGTVRKWSVPSLQLLAEFPGDPFVLGNVAATPTSAVVVFDDGAGIVWPLRLTDWETRACRIAGRNLTHTEWQQLLPGVKYSPACAP
jgi:DNA-binding SARP family transcriptional activator/WD40 repeat protein